MANTFHCKSSDGIAVKSYLIHESSVRNHSIWRSEKFWERALMSAVKGQLIFQDPVKWDELDQSVLTDTVISAHNLIFGQLGSLAFTMHELGLEFEEVMFRVRDLSRIFELSEDQCFQLVQSVKSTFSAITVHGATTDEKLSRPVVVTRQKESSSPQKSSLSAFDEALLVLAPPAASAQAPAGEAAGK